MTRIGMSLAALLAVIGLSALDAAAAQTRPIQDRVRVELEVEDWVKTESATVRVAVEAAFSAAEAASVRIKVLEALSRLVADVDWHITGYQQTRDQTGLQRWQVAAETRLNEALLGRLDDKARAISKPGMQVKVRQIDFTPTLAERQTAATALRQRIYALAREELERLRKAYPKRGFRVHAIDFVGRGIQPMPTVRGGRPMTMQAETSAAMPAMPADAIAVKTKLVVRATVVLAATPPGQ